MSEPQPDPAASHPAGPSRDEPADGGAGTGAPHEDRPGTPPAAGPYAAGPYGPQPGHDPGRPPEPHRPAGQPDGTLGQGPWAGQPGWAQGEGPWAGQPGWAQGEGPWAGQPGWAQGQSFPPYPWQPRTTWAVPPPAGTRYDRLARTAAHRWWRPVVGTLLIVAAFLVVSIGVGLLAALVSLLLGTQMAMGGDRIFADPVLDLGVHLGVIALAIPLVFGAAWAVQRRLPGSLSSVALRFRWRWLGACLVVALVAVVLGQLVEGATLEATGEDPGYRWAGWEAFLPPMILILVLVPFQAAAEEYAFRGWILQSFGAYLRNPWPGILLGSVAFAALHGYTEWGIAYVFGFGILMGWLAILTGGLEAPIALHATNNVVAFGVVAASGDMGGALQQGSLPWQSLTGTLVQFAVYGIGIVVIARKRAIQTLSR
ncbi:CPBP family intramembrane glutamic endopeptidase [Microbispora sp. ATCC PTA-5024]|uniref:CPBP family intramembrane glutamic endopeptidase n=1 Tax=Microbispora sp. ATCC PTA-5024 TaxID=316330 RepID=UPI0003DDBEDC|nr:CPBP family intramembrane glutamic endopeptidase [Microbispora sp. ATCC PTA-5024]ETK31209.1 hypothetical protein MPTA5024_36230 [Microbispora sp. ATCC PTA-5024]